MSITISGAGQRRVTKKNNNERDLSQPKEILRLVRNGIAHARVEIGENYFLISDQLVIGDVPNGPVYTVRLDWCDLGKIADAYLCAVDECYIRGDLNHEKLCRSGPGQQSGTGT